MVGGNADVSLHRNRHTAAQAPPPDRRDERLLEFSKGVEQAAKRGPSTTGAGPATGQPADVGARNKRALSGSLHDAQPHLRITGELLQDANCFCRHPLRESIVTLRIAER